ncbi:SurA N-terminal domain-containing protein [Microaerobacter geothermalis]|uniref:SurA N-terminal domain-containing protein n=1 Tax=Microaerobacter geothermalis TaxID=674972 RepID=UPI001F1DCC9D|nr:SurA N-terminal domain-containing protein [Microaerobacter geothermalis]MCF6093705.1 SurA N-terminal domain-containing protein [Microaerobacter geothermalis]
MRKRYVRMMLLGILVAGFISGCTSERNNGTDLVAKVNDEMITRADLDYQVKLDQLQFAINEEDIRKNFTGSELEGRLSDLNREKNAYTEKNALMKMIRFIAMTNIAKKENMSVTDEEVKERLDSYIDQLEIYGAYQKFIKEMGENKFKAREKEKMKDVILIEKVTEKLKGKVAKENPGVDEQHLSFLAKKAFDDIVVQELDNSKVEIYLEDK